MSVTLSGMNELRAALLALPEELTGQAATIVESHATIAASLIEAVYPEGPTGNLKRGVTVEHNSSKFAASTIVRSRARHATLYERGTRQRHTHAGANRGRMPQAPEGRRMIPIVVRMRARMVQALVNMVRENGFAVSGQ